MSLRICADPDEAVAGLTAGITLLIGGFGGAGQPIDLIDAVLRSGVSDLTVVNNNAGNGDTGLAPLLAGGQVRKLICSYPRQSDSWVFDRLYRSGEIEPGGRDAASGSGASGVRRTRRRWPLLGGHPGVGGLGGVPA